MRLERFFRDHCEQQLKNTHHDENVSLFYVEYISRVLAAIKELGLETAFATDRVPQIENVDYSTYVNFGKDVEYYKTMLQIRHARRIQDQSVHFDADTKRRIHDYITKIREIIAKLEVSQPKKTALSNKLNALALEVDRDLARSETYGALVIEAAGILGEAAEKAEPVRKWLESIGKLLWRARRLKIDGNYPHRQSELNRPASR